MGYSFGGIVISEWLYRRGATIQALPGFRGTCLIASPIRLQASRVRYAYQSPRTGEARGYVDRLLSGYTAIPEHVPLIGSLVLIRCGRDRLVGDEAYTFADRPLDDRPIETAVDATHQDIVVSEKLREPLVDAVLALCDRRLPHFAQP